MAQENGPVAKLVNKVIHRGERNGHVFREGSSFFATSIIDAIVIKDEELFFLSAPSGNVLLQPGHGLGLYYHDCRFLDGYELKIGGYPVNLRGDVCTSADAGGLTIAPMLVTVEEVDAAINQGKPINHAIRLILPNSRIASYKYVRPATHTTGSSSGWASSTAGVPYGAQFRLKSTAAVQAKISLMVPAAQVIAAALQSYGMILADGGNIAFTFKSDQFSTLKWANYNLDSHAFFETSASALVPTDFDVVNVGAPSAYLDGSSFNCVRTQGIP